MSLITCPECKKSVSDAAVTCPQCGYPLTRAKTPSQVQASPQNGSPRLLIGGVLGGLLLVGILGGMYLMKSPEQSPAENPQAVATTEPNAASTTNAAANPPAAANNASQTNPATTPASEDAPDNRCQILADGAGNVKLGMTVEAAQKAFPEAVFALGTGIDGIPIVDVKLGSETLMALYANQIYDAKNVNLAGVIDSIQIYNPKCYTAEGVHPGMLISDAEKKLGPLVSISHSEMGNQNIKFTNNPQGISLDSYGVGIFPPNAPMNALTTQYKPDGTIRNIWIKKQ